MRTYDWMHKVEVTLMTKMSCSLHDIDETDTASLFALLGYLERSTHKAAPRLIKLGRRQYRRVTADSANWL